MPAPAVLLFPRVASGPTHFVRRAPAPDPSTRSPPSRKRCSGRRLVAREGFEPSKALGRQIYSLLRLTAPQPRPTTDRAGTRWDSESGFVMRPQDTLVRPVPCTKLLELAKGFEPPTG